MAMFMPLCSKHINGTIQQLLIFQIYVVWVQKERSCSVVPQSSCQHQCLTFGHGHFNCAVDDFSGALQYTLQEAY